MVNKTITMMKIMDEASFNEINNKLDKLTKLLEVMDTSTNGNMNWFTGEQVTKFLSVSKRTLQNYRDQGLIGFSQIGRKILYRQSDVDKFLEKNYIPKYVSKEEQRRERKILEPQNIFHVSKFIKK